jgi:hypothetical protein
LVSNEVQRSKGGDLLGLGLLEERIFGKTLVEEKFPETEVLRDMNQIKNL